MNRDLMILFAKAPVPGKVKTRLVPAITPEQAAQLHRQWVESAWDLLTSFRPAAQVELHTDVPTGAWARMHPRRLQPGGDLGHRMLTAIRGGLEAGHRRCLIAGSDAPGLPRPHLAELLESPADVALGPTDDGGYYAIACRRWDARMFEGVRWSTGHALEDTVAAVKACRLSVGIGPGWFDVDTPDDLARLGIRV